MSDPASQTSGQALMQAFDAHPVAVTVLAMPIVLAVAFGIFLMFRAIFSN